jgi:hypothetical protein
MLFPRTRPIVLAARMMGRNQMPIVLIPIVLVIGGLLMLVLVLDKRDAR